LLHWNHIREGRVGAWQAQATPRQRLVLALLCGAWLKARGYEANDGWALNSVAVIDRLSRELEGLRRANAECQALMEADLRRTEDRLAGLERLGPVALRLAAWFHETSLRHPRLRDILKKLIGVGGEEKEPSYSRVLAET